jgi:RNA polymerase sigma factor (sigma-70 family)
MGISHAQNHRSLIQEVGIDEFEKKIFVSNNIYKGIDNKIIKQVKFYARRLKKSQLFNFIDIEDIEQELMIEIILNIRSFNHEVSDLSTFASKILDRRSKNILRNVLRQKRFNSSGTVQLDENEIEANGDDTKHLNMKSDIDQCIERLPKKFKTICELLKIHNQTETAKILGVSRSTISTHVKILSIILKHLKDYTSIQNGVTNENN